MDDVKNKVKWLSWQKNFNESNKNFFFYSLNSLIFLTIIWFFFQNFLTFLKILYRFGKKIQSYKGETVNSITRKILECNTDSY